MRADWLAQHPEIPPRIANAIRQGAITQGMSKAEVIASWGKPCCAVYRPWVTHTPNGDVWLYTPDPYVAGTYIYFDKTGHVAFWTQSD